MGGYVESSGWNPPSRCATTSTRCATSAGCTTSVGCGCFFAEVKGFYFIVVVWRLTPKRSFLRWGIPNVGSGCSVNCDVIFRESMSGLWVNRGEVHMFFLNCCW